MSLSSRTKNALMDKFNTTFASIGTANGMKMPRSGNNREQYAWELFIAQYLHALAGKRKDAAEKMAIANGVIFNKDTDPKPAGTKEVVFSGEVVLTSVEVRSGAKRVDHKMFVDYLIDHGVKRELIEVAANTATVTNKPAHVFSTMLVTTEATEGK